MKKRVKSSYQKKDREFYIGKCEECKAEMTNKDSFVILLSKEKYHYNCLNKKQQQDPKHNQY